MKRLIALVSVTIIAACGQKTDLEPVAGRSLPPAPYGAKAQPDAAALLEPDPHAAPERTVELRKRSEEREDDPFDLPPE